MKETFGAQHISITREELLAEIAATKRFDLAIVGGGIHGAMAAKIAAFSGISTVLLERADYGSETSGRSSKMAHGGLRYLEMLDFAQVFEGIRCREQLFTIAPDLCRPYPFQIPIKRGEVWLRLKLKAGLHLYDRFIENSDRRHRWLTPAELKGTNSALSSTSLSGAFQYTDGIMDDVGIVHAAIFDARSHGAQCCNYVAVEKIEESEEDATLLFRDTLTGREGSCRARFVLNCAGPWVGNVRPSSEHRHLFSRGAHLLFDVPWTKPALFLPLPGRARYYFVWPHPGGTMVGTTEREVSEAESDPLPWPDEIEEILTRITRDLPEAGLNRSSLYYAFAGVRSLPVRSHSTSVAQISRRHQWAKEGRVLSLYGGKYTTAAATALEGLRIGARFFDRPVKELSRDRLHLPWDREESLRGKVECMIRLSQAQSIDDLMRRRLEVELLPGSGLNELDEVAKVATEQWGSSLVEHQVSEYRKRVERVRSLCGIRNESAGDREF